MAGLLATARALANRGRWGLPDAILYLDTPAGERALRARRDPVGHPADLRARHVRVAEEERRLYRTVLAPAFGHRFRVVSGRGLPSAVARRLATAARSVASARIPPPDLGPILDALDLAGSVP